MDVLVKAASLMNPKQFELPRNMSVPCLFPGTDKGNTPGFFFKFKLVLIICFS